MSVIKRQTETIKVELDHWSHSQDQAFRQCLLKWFRRTVLGWEAKRVADPLYRGSAIHYALEHFHAVAPDDRSLDLMRYHFAKYYSDARAKLIEMDLPESEIDDFDAWHSTVGIKTIQELWKKYGQDDEILATTVTEFTGHAKIPGTDVPYEFRLDGLMPTEDGSYAILEHKTMKRDDSELYLDFDLQIIRNIWAANLVLKPDKPITRGLFNFIVWPGPRKGAKFTRKWVEPSEYEIEYATHDLASVIAEAQRDDLFIHHRFGRDCKWSCEFFKLCNAQKGSKYDEATLLERLFNVRDTTTGTIAHVDIDD